MTFRECLLQTLENVFEFNDRSDFQESTEEDHVEGLSRIHFDAGIHRVDFVDVDILSRRFRRDTVRVIDQCSARFNGLLELIQ